MNELGLKSPADALTGLAPLVWGEYAVREATERDMEAVFRLRHETFFGDKPSEGSGDELDRDEFDDFADCLVVTHRPDGQAQAPIVGCYRLLPMSRLEAVGMAPYNGQYYDVSRILTNSGCVNQLELGRFCVAAEHRSRAVLLLLLRGVMQYIIRGGYDGLFGGVSLTGMDDVEIAQLDRWLWEQGHYDEALLDPALVLDHPTEVVGEAYSPKRLLPLLRIYLGLGTKICSGPLYYPPLRSYDYLIHLKTSSIPASRLRHLGVPAT